MSMFKNTSKRRVLSWILTLTMLFSQFFGTSASITALAADEHPVEVSTWADLKTALTTDGAVITLTDDISCSTNTAGNLEVPGGISTKIILNGKTISLSNNLISVFGTLTIEGTGSITGGTGVEAVWVQNGKFVQNGGSISGNASGVFVESKATYEMKAGVVSGNTQYGVQNNGTFTMSGSSEIFGNGSTEVVNTSTGTFTMEGGKIYDITEGSGAGVVNQGAFTMRSGEIYGNALDGVDNSNTFEMEGGKIHNNAKSGVFTATKFTMNAGSVFMNNDSGVNVSGGTFDLNGGTISGNTSSHTGAGVLVPSGAIANLAGGDIYGNTSNTGAGNGVYCSGTLTVSGNVKIHDNGSHNVFLDNKTIKVVGELGADAVIYASLVATPNIHSGSGKVAEGYAAYEISESDSEKFISDYSYYKTSLLENGIYFGRQFTSTTNITWDESKWANAVYNGAEQTFDDAVVSVQDGDTVLTKGTEYTIGYENNKNAGTATIKVVGEGAYSGSVVSKNFTIAKKSVSVDGIIAGNKVYDGTVSANLDTTVADGKVTVYGLQGTDTVTVSADGAFVNANVGDGKVVNISNLTISGDKAVNYELNVEKSQKTASANISKRPVKVTALHQAVELNEEVSSDVKYASLSSDAVEGHKLAEITISTNSTASYTTNGVLKPSAAKIVDGNNGDADVTANYDITYEEGSLSVNKAKAYFIDGKEPTIPNLTYDGTAQKLLVSANASVSGGTLMYVSANSISDDTVWSKDVPTATDAGTYKVWYMVSGNESHVSSNAVSVNVTIAKRPVTVSGIKAESKTYDGTTSVNLVYANVSFNGLVSQNGIYDTLTVSADGAFADANAGDKKTVNITNLTISGNASANYVLASSGQQTTTTADIAKKWVTVSEGIAAKDKTYDATTSVELIFDNVSINGVVDKDKANVSVTASGVFTQAEVSENKVPVSINGIKLTGSASVNYSLSDNDLQETTSANIIQKEVTVKAKDQEININGHIINDPQMAELIGAIKGHSLYAVSLNTAWDTSKRTSGVPITVSVDEVKIRNTAGVNVTANYKVVSEDGILVVKSGIEAEITEAPVANTLSYNQTNQELVTAGTANTSVLYVVSENDAQIPVDGWSSNIPTGYNAGTYFVWFKAAGNDNYDETEPVKVTVVIDRKAVSVNRIEVKDKVYDGTTAAEVINLSDKNIDGLYQRDLLDVEVTAEFADTIAGTDRVVNITEIKLSGVDIDNYVLDEDASQKTTTADITKKLVTVTAKNQTVSLNGKIVNTVSMATLDGAIDGHVLGSVKLTSSETNNITTNGEIYVSDVKIVESADPNHDMTSNYDIQPVNGVMEVVSAESEVTAVPTAKTSLSYNGADQALLNNDGAASGGDLVYVLGGESAVGSSNWSDTIPTGKNAGTYYVWYKVAGDANHDDTDPAGPIEVTIAKKSVKVSGIKVNSKTYDGTTAVTFDFSSAAFDGKVVSDVLTVADAAGAFENANVGTDKKVNITANSITLGGTSEGNYTVDHANSQKEAAGNITKRPVKVIAKDQTVSLNGTIVNTVDMATLSSNGVGILTAVSLSANSTAHVTTTGTITPSAAAIRFGTADATDNFEIEYVSGNLIVNPIAATVLTAPTAKTLSFNNAQQALVSDNATVSGGSIQYAVSDNATTAPADGWSEEIPTAKEVGSYYVWYKAVADDDHFDSVSACVTSTINAAEITIFFDANYEGGKGVSQNATISTADDVVTLSTNSISRNGYIFTEWNTKADGEGTAYADGAEFTPSVNAAGFYDDVTLYAQWDSVSIDSISVNKAPDKTEYVEGQKFDTTGMVVVANCTNGTAKEITDYTYTPSGNLAISDNKVIISYTEGGLTFTTSQNITVVSVSLDSISINKLPNKTSYIERELFDPAGMEVAATYNNGETKNVTDYTWTPNTNLTLADTTVVVSYTEKEVTRTASFNIVVSENTAPSLVSISINKAPAKTEYVEGDAFDAAGMEVSANYSDGSSKAVSGYTITPSVNLTTSDNKVIVSYTEEGITCTADVAIKVKAKDATDVIVEDEEYSSWNLFEDASEHTFVIAGANGNGTANTNSKSTGFYKAELNGDTITVSVTGNRKDAAKAANAVLEFVTENGVVEFTLPVEYKKPVMKLSATKATVKNGVETVVKTTILRKSPAGILEPMDLSDAEVKFGANEVEKLENGEIGIVVKGTVKGQKISVTGEGWAEAVELAYSVKAVDKNVITVEMGTVKTVIVNKNADKQSFNFPVLLNGVPAEESDISITGKGAALAKIENGELVIAYPEAGIKKGSYTVTLKSGDAKANVKVKVSEKELSKAVVLKVQTKYDVVTGQKMVLVPKFNDLGGKLNGVSIKDNDNFSAELNDAGNIVVDYVGETPLTKDSKNIGNLVFLLDVEDIDDEVAITAANLKASVASVKVKASKVFISGNGEGVANIVCSYKDKAGNQRLVAPVSITNITTKGVTSAKVSEDDPTAIVVSGLSKKSGSVKATVNFPGGYSKKVTISVKSK